MKRLIAAMISALILAACGDAGSDDGRLCEGVGNLCERVDRRNEGAKSPDSFDAIGEFCEYDETSDVIPAGHACDPIPTQDRCVWLSKESLEKNSTQMQYDVWVYCECLPDGEIAAYQARVCPDE